MRNINIYKIDANGDKQQFSASEYTLQFDCSENGVQSDGEKGAGSSETDGSGCNPFAGDLFL